MVGPHRDDFLISANGADLARYGSRGQQRLAVVAIKLAELDLLGDAAGEPPVLLLDDVLSELDVAHRSMIVATIAARKRKSALRQRMNPTWHHPSSRISP